MNIILGTDYLEDVRDKYVVLELDTFRMMPENRCVTAYGLVENLNIVSLHRTDEFKKLHHDLMKNYRLRNWEFCEHALEHLIPFWGNDMRSFYEILTERIQTFKDQSPGEDWDGSVIKYADSVEFSATPELNRA